MRQSLRDADATEACDDAEMLVSELATNALLHANTQFEVMVLRTGDTVRVTVTDGSTALPRRRSFGSESTTGRGLRLVASMSSAWGVEEQAGGKAVWFELPAAGVTAVVPTWEEVDAQALLAAFDDPDLDGDPPVHLMVAA